MRGQKPPPSHPGYLTRPPHHVHPEDIECVYQQTHGKGAIYLGNVESAQNIETLKQRNIGSLLTSCKNIHIRHPKEYVPYTLYIPGEDHKDYDLSLHFETAVDFIHQSRKETNILVHCMAGISRSATLVIAYLMKYKDMSMQEAFSTISSKRRKINPNPGFMKQLHKYERELRQGKDRRQMSINHYGKESGVNYQLRPSSSNKYGGDYHEKMLAHGNRPFDKYDKYFTRDHSQAFTKKYNPEYEPTLGLNLNNNYNFDKLYQNTACKSTQKVHMFDQQTPSKHNRSIQPFSNCTNYHSTVKAAHKEHNTSYTPTTITSENNIQHLSKDLDDRINKIKQKYYERTHTEERALDVSGVDRLSLGMEFGRSRLENRDVLRSSVFNYKSRPMSYQYGGYM